MHRILGRRKLKYITILDKLFDELTSYGVNSSYLVKLYKLDDPYAIQTKRFTGIIGEIKQLVYQERKRRNA